MQIGDRVITPDGSGTIKAIEQFKLAERFGVLLDNSKECKCLYYFKKEIEVLKR